MVKSRVEGGGFLVDWYKKLVGKWFGTRKEMADEQNKTIADLEKKIAEKKAKPKRVSLVQGGKTKLQGGDIGHDIMDGLAGPIGWIILARRKAREKKIKDLQKKLEGKGIWDLPNVKRKLEDLANKNPKIQKLIEIARKKHNGAKGGSSLTKGQRDAIMSAIEEEERRSGWHQIYTGPSGWEEPRVRKGGDGTRPYPNTLAPKRKLGGDGKHPYPNTLAPKTKGGMLASEISERYGDTLEEEFEKWKERRNSIPIWDRDQGYYNIRKRLRNPNWEWDEFMESRKNRPFLKSMRGGAAPRTDFNSLLLTAGLSNLRDKLQA